MSKIKKVLIALLAVVVVGSGAGALWWFRMGPGAAAAADAAAIEDEIILVETAMPEHGNIAVRSEFIGTADPGQQVTVYPKAAGEVLEVNFKVGDTVSAGDVLVKIDSKALESSIAQMQASLASLQAKADLSLEMAEKNLNTTQHNLEEGYDEAIIRAEKGVEVAEADVKGQREVVDDIRDLIRDLRDDKVQVADGTTYEAEIKKQQSALVQNEILLEGAEIGLEQALELLRSAQEAKIAQENSLEDSVELAELNSNFSDQQIALQKLQDDLENYSVTSQISGVIEQRSVEVYDMAAPQSPLFVISDKNAMSVNFSVAESALEYIAVGDAVTLEKNGETAEGEISEISTMADARTGLYAVKARVENVPFALHSGSAVKVFADTRKAENDLLIPIDTIYYEAGKPFVYVAENGAAKKTFIETGMTDDMAAQVLSGLTGEENLITSWNPILGDGVKIEVVENAAAAEGTASPQAEGEAP